MMGVVHLLGFSLGDGEFFVLIVLVLTAIASNRGADFLRGLRRAIFEFRKSSGDVAKELDQAGFDAGQSLGGIYGKPASEALTTENQNVELYDHSVFRDSIQDRHTRESARQKKKDSIIRKLLFVAGGIGFGVLACRLCKFML